MIRATGHVCQRHLKTDPLAAGNRVLVLVMVPLRILRWTGCQAWETWRERHVLHRAIVGKPARRRWVGRMAERSASTTPKPPEVLVAGDEIVVLDDTEIAVPDDSGGPIGPHDFRPGTASPDYVPDEWEDIWQAHLRRLERRKRWEWLTRWFRRDDGPTGQDGS